jgi:hypothetical protein
MRAGECGQICRVRQPGGALTFRARDPVFDAETRARNSSEINEFLLCMGLFLRKWLRKLKKPEREGPAVAAPGETL